MKTYTQSDIENCRYDHRYVHSHAEDRTAVIVATQNSISLGVQYWTKEEVEKGSQSNTDGTVSYFVEYLYPQIKTFKNNHFKSRNPECTNIVFCQAEKAPNDYWTECSEDEIEQLKCKPLWREDSNGMSVKYFGYL